MEVVRYIIEHLPKHDDPHHELQRSVVRQHSRRHVWMRLDGDIILVMAHIDPQKLENLRQSVCVLPCLHDRTPLKSTVPEPLYSALKQRFNLDDSHCTADLLGKVLAEGHYAFEPPI